MNRKGPTKKKYSEARKVLAKISKDVMKLNDPAIYPSDLDIKTLYHRIEIFLDVYLADRMVSRPQGIHLDFIDMKKDNVAYSNNEKLRAIIKFIELIPPALVRHEKFFSDVDNEDEDVVPKSLTNFWDKYLWPVLLTVAGGLLVAFLAKYFGWL